MPVIKCKCGSTDCTLIPYSRGKEGAKTGGWGGALVGALIGLAGGPIGAIAGAAIGAGGGALIGKDQSTDCEKRPIEKYQCNSCKNKFEACPQCGCALETYSTKESKNGNDTTRTYCKNCKNHIGTKIVTAAEKQAMRNSSQVVQKGAQMYVNQVRNNIDNLSSMYDDYDDYD